MLTTSFFKESLFLCGSFLRLNLDGESNSYYVMISFSKNSSGQVLEVNSKDELSVLNSAPQ